MPARSPATTPPPPGSIPEIRSAQSCLDTPLDPFTGDEELLHTAQTLFGLVGATRQAPTDSDRLAAQDLLPRLRARIRERLSLARCPDGDDRLLQEIHKHSLSLLDTELLLLITLYALGAKLFDIAGKDVEDLSHILVHAGHEALPVSRAFQPASPLVKAGLIRIQESSPWIYSPVSLAPALLFALNRPAGDEPWEVKNFNDFLERTAELTYQMEEQASESKEDECPGELDLPHRIEHFLGQIRATLAAHPDWPLSAAASPLGQRELAILLALIGKDMGYLPCGHEFYTGAGLAGGLGASTRGSKRLMRLFAESATLRRLGWIQPLTPSGPGGVTQTGEDTLAEASWELTDEAREQFRVPLRRRLETGALRRPFTQLGDLVLHEEVHEALRMAVAQARNPSRLFEQWGLGRIMGYGRGITLLFSGPSGVGKTAAAEALATLLGRPLMEADGARLLSCWVGETEKHLARSFREAAYAKAVLFFDEADAFFYDRSSAVRQWEVSQVNVLLRELERFDGVCILATNRHESMDPAFERRLTMKVEFRMPTPEMAARIWKIHLPEQLPLADDVDVEALSRLSLTGGQIKNAVLNASRWTVAAGEKKVTMAALVRAARAEIASASGRIGFNGKPAAGRCSGLRDGEAA